MTIKKLKEILSKYDDNDESEVIMCMDWSKLEEIPEHLNQQWEDNLGEAFKVKGKDNNAILMLVNRHFK